MFANIKKEITTSDIRCLWTDTCVLNKIFQLTVIVKKLNDLSMNSALRLMQICTDKWIKDLNSSHLFLKNVAYIKTFSWSSSTKSTERCFSGGDESMHRTSNNTVCRQFAVSKFLYPPPPPPHTHTHNIAETGYSLHKLVPPEKLFIFGFSAQAQTITGSWSPFLFRIWIAKWWNINRRSFTRASEWED